jgi:hypothetical protein
MNWIKITNYAIFKAKIMKQVQDDTEDKASHFRHPELVSGSLSVYNLIFLLSLSISLLFPIISHAEELQASFQDWNVFKTMRGDKEICYMASIPIKQSGNYHKRGQAYFLVTNIINDADEISTSSGFLYKKMSDVELSFGSKKFYLFPYLSLAWANDKNDDIDIIKQMQKSDEIIVTGISRDHKIANDSYSLIGFSQAYNKMKEICHGYANGFR